MAIVASFAAGYFYVKSQVSTTISVNDEIVTPEITPEVLPTSEEKPMTTTNPTVTPKAGHTAVVVFEPPLGNDFADKALIQARIVNPFLDYYADENGEGYLVSLSISENKQDSKATYPYLGSAIFKNGGNSGFVIAKINGVIPWWAPDCMKCTFSASFKATYPEIVKQYE